MTFIVYDYVLYDREHAEWPMRGKRDRNNSAASLFGLLALVLLCSK